MLTAEQRQRIQDALADRGLTFKPLQDEMVDHVGCDIEAMMNSGESFEEALNLTIQEIPPEHFVTIQRDTLLVINERLALSKWLSYLVVGSLLLALTFKTLHLQFTRELLILSFILITVALITSSFSGIYAIQEKKGIGAVIAVITSVVFLQLGYVFKIMHWPRADAITLTAVITTIGALLSNTLKVYRHPPGKETMLTFLHERYTPAIERFLVMMLSILIVIKITTIIFSFQFPEVRIILLIIVFGAGLQFIAMTWRLMEQQIAFKTTFFLIAITGTSLFFALPFLGELIHSQIRILSIVLFTLFSASLAYRMQHLGPNMLAQVSVIFVSILFIASAALKLQIFQTEWQHHIFNLPVLIMLVSGVLLSKRHQITRSYMTLCVAAYLIEYPW